MDVSQDTRNKHIDRLREAFFKLGCDAFFEGVVGRPPSTDREFRQHIPEFTQREIFMWADRAAVELMDKAEFWRQNNPAQK